MVASRNTEAETPSPDDLYDVGVLGAVARMIRVPDGTLRVLIQGGPRIRIVRWVRTEPYLVAEIAEAPDVVEHTPELTALMRNVQNRSRTSSSRFRTCPRSSRSWSPTSTTRACWRT